MERKELETLRNWLLSSNRKPLVIRGARQVGKTWLVRQLAKFSGKHLIELNFEKQPNYADLFQTNDPRKVLFAVEAALNVTINIEESILFLDEIQATPEIFAKLRWFAEELPNLAVIAAGSLLEFVLGKHEFSMPVGRISYFHLEPLSFQEYLVADGKNKSLEFISNYQFGETIPQIIHQQLLESVKEFLVIGGMPAVVDSWIESRSLLKVSEIQHDLLTTYRDDFSKYGSRIDSSRIESVLMTAPKLLGQKFKYSTVSRDIPASSLKKVLSLLCKARLCYKVRACAGNGMPLDAEINEKINKVILLDVGLICAILGLTLPDITNISNVQLINQGTIVEQFVGQQLRMLRPSFVEPKLYYWQRERTGSTAELDYLIQHKGNIVPIEVKSGKTGTLKSLHLFMALKGYSTAIRINTDYPSIVKINTVSTIGKKADYQLLSIPLYLTEQIDRLLSNQKK